MSYKEPWAEDRLEKVRFVRINGNRVYIFLIKTEIKTLKEIKIHI